MGVKRPTVCSRVLVLTGAVSILVGGTPEPLIAQGASCRAAIQQFPDSLASIAHGPTLDRLRVEWLAYASRQEDAEAFVRSGALSIRLAELGEQGQGLGRGPSARDAERAFAEARRLEPGWACAWYGYGLAKLALAEWQLATPENLGFRVGVGAMEDAFRALARAAELDPVFAPALGELARTALRLRSRHFLRTARDALRRARILGLGDPEALRLSGQLERRAGDPDSALAAFESYVGLGGNPGLGALEIARTRLAHGLPEGEGWYYAGAAKDDSATVQAYRDDLALIATADELATFDSARGPGRVVVLRDFWSRRDDRDLRARGERLREHYRRLLYARTHFYLENTRRHYWQGEPFRSGSDEFDDRAIVYIRHGEPSQRIVPFVYGLTGNESWRYAGTDGDLVLHFTVREDLRDYRLAASIFDLKSTGSTPRDQLIMSRQPLSPLYSKLGTWGRFGRAKLLSRERAMGENGIAIGTSTDSHELRYREPLEPRPQLFIVGREENGKSLLHLVLAVDASTLTSADRLGPFRIRFAVFDAEGSRIAGLDSSVLGPPEATAGPGAVFMRVAVAVPPGEWSYRMAVESTGDRGALLPRDTVRVRSFGGPGPALSDLMLGLRTGPLVWYPTESDTVYIDPRATFSPALGERLELYYEAYGLGADRAYRTSLTITEDGSDDLRLRLAFEGVAAGEVVRERRTVGLETLPRGLYWLAVELTDDEGRSTVSRRRFRVAR